MVLDTGTDSSKHTDASSIDSTRSDRDDSAEDMSVKDYRLSSNEIDHNVDKSSLEDLEKLGIHHTTSLRPEPSVHEAPYTVFSKRAKRFLVIQCAFTGIFSTIASAIYYPVLTVIEGQFHITEELVNLTVVVYFIFQGISPLLMGTVADRYGRRPIVLGSLITYFCACVGLARATNYSQMLGLRCLQAAGISPVTAINSAIVGDITTRAERGGYVGYVSGFQVFGAAFGALLGAGLSSRWGWRANFWFLAIGSGACFIISFFAMPETKRSIVGNGSIVPKRIVNRAPILTLPHVRNALHLKEPDTETLEPETDHKIWDSLTILLNPKISLLLLIAALQFATWSVHQTALSYVASSTYHLSVAKVGLTYLPTGICTLISIVSAGRYLNWSYKRRYVKYQNWYEEQKIKLMSENNGDEARVQEIMDGNSKYYFNVFEARLHAALITINLSSAGFIAFGWCISQKVPLAAVLCTSGFGSLFSNCIMTFCSTLIVDIYPKKASTAMGCVNIFRCLLSALFVGVLTKMKDKMEYGGVFTLYSGLTTMLSSSLLYLIARGKQMEYQRRNE